MLIQINNNINYKQQYFHFKNVYFHGKSLTLINLISFTLMFKLNSQHYN